MRHLPLRVRVTLAFATAMALLLLALSVFLVLRLEAQLDLAIDQGLESRVADISALADGSPDGGDIGSPGRLGDDDASTTQLLDQRNQVLHATPSSSRTSLLTQRQLAAARRHPLFLDVRVGGEHAPVRLLAAATGDRDVVVVVGQSLETRHDTVDQLRRQLTIGVPVALLIASVAGYLAAAAALRPVRAMTRQARAIEGSALADRLGVPPGGDEITELGDTLNAMLDRLDDAMQRERGFVADASHELRTPLAIIDAELQVALRSDGSPEAHRETLESLAAQNARVVRLAEDLLVLARADQHRLPMRAEPLDVGIAVASCARRFSPRAEQHGLRITAGTDDDLFVEADEVRLDQLLDNLVENALRYATGAVRLTAGRTAGGIVLSVADDGPGFPAAFVDRAFDRFAMADDSRTGGHAGLGLAIVRAIAEAHGWTSTVPPTSSGAVVEVRMTPLGGPPAST
ncbi:HAMP domain-containing sensor histidine kinase [Patulibacter minatonensis]|uniref:HAMP domain-containing sensor histidine kinase n=1 Tax=Patulibacter minatonensis TaxID=298163 RepID=UPI00047A8311|nr:ATP-binding protein [Patulibacter minatonensis]